MKAESNDRITIHKFTNMRCINIQIWST